MTNNDKISTIWDLARLESELRTEIEPARYDIILAKSPPEFLKIAHYAALWGVSDDRARSDLVRAASSEARQNLKSIVDIYEDELEHWLTGPESDGPEFSEAYIAFSAMIMASDELR